MDNMNIHIPASLYKTFPTDEAKRIWDCLEIHYTPKHGGWLNMAEIEFGVLNKRGLPERVLDIETLCKGVTDWVTLRNSSASSINWQFTSPNARIKLKRLYPKL